MYWLWKRDAPDVGAKETGLNLVYNCTFLSWLGWDNRGLLIQFPSQSFFSNVGPKQRNVCLERKLCEKNYK